MEIKIVVEVALNEDEYSGKMCGIGAEISKSI